MQDICLSPNGTFAAAVSINRSGMTVGNDYCNDPKICGSLIGRAFLHTAGVTHALTSLVEAAPTGWNVDEAYLINDRGDIAAMSNSARCCCDLLPPRIPRPSFLP